MPHVQRPVTLNVDSPTSFAIARALILAARVKPSEAETLARVAESFVEHGERHRQPPA